jgi:hypothetical protein
VSWNPDQPPFQPPGWQPGTPGAGGGADGNPLPPGSGAAVSLPAPTGTSIDFKTIADKYNEGLPRSPMYEFSGGRKFYNPDDL